jgi:hypothetical protein
MSATPGLPAREPQGETGLLENMSSRPRTQIRRDVPPVRQGWVLFDLNLLSTGAEPDVILPEERARLEARWHALGLTGATLAHRSRVAPPDLEPLPCRDDELILNVLLRVRGNLLIYGMPMLDIRDPTASSALICADERLHAIVVAANTEVRRAKRRTPSMRSTTRRTS